MTIASVQLDHLGVLPRMELKGSEAAPWLRDRSIILPDEIFSTGVLAGDGWIARLGAAEFLVEDSAQSNFVSQLWGDLSPLPTGVFPVHRSDVTFVLSGPEARAVLAQTCAIDFGVAPPQYVIFSRVAGVSCGILPEVSAGVIKYRLWVELSYAAYLWETLAGIVKELSGITN
jgi:sarcosine oxidase gamma subunit